MFHQTIYKGVYSLLTVLLLAWNLALSPAAQAATTDYDGLWDFKIDCLPTRNLVTASPVVSDFSASRIENGKGEFLFNSPTSQHKLWIEFKDNQVTLKRTTYNLQDRNRQFNLELKGALTDQSNIKLTGTNWPAGVAGTPSDCTFEGIKK